MNSKFRKIDIEKLVFFDIETAARNTVLDLDSKEFELYKWKLRNKETGEFPPNDEVQNHYKLNAALFPEYNKIICISLGFVKGSVAYYKSLVGEQKEIIEEFYNIVASNGLIPCGVNIKNFDLPTTRIKAFESGVDMLKCTDKISDVAKTPWVFAEDVVDLMDYFKGTYYTNIGLDAMCMLAGVDSPKDSIKGSDVSRVYYEGGLDQIVSYCSRDVVATIQLFCSMQGRKDFITEFIDRTGAQTKQEKTPLLNSIYNQGSISQDHKEQILETAKGLTKKEKEGFITLIKASLARTVKEGYTEDEESLFNEIMSVKKTTKKK